MKKIGIKQLYPGAINPFPWVSEVWPEDGKELLRNTRHRVSDGWALSWD